MIVITLNCGSSSVKYSLFDMPNRVRLCHGIVERVTSDNAIIRYSRPESPEFVRSKDCPTHVEAIRSVLDLLIDRDMGVIRDLSEINAAGHRVVHGGDCYSEPAVIDDVLMLKIGELSCLAPLHNPANLAGIKVLKGLLPDIPQVAVFDTAFFRTMPAYVFMYGLPFEWYEKYKVRRYGFHGTSHRYVYLRAVSLLDRDARELKIITLHIGNGVSLTAIRNGQAYDHSMGFTPLEGLLMGTRCGDVDPGIILHIMEKEKLDPQQMDNILNRKSGFLGITGRFSDRREILKAMLEGDGKSRLAFDMECYRLQKYIGAFAAGMGGVDAIVFTAGAGENSFLHRQKICEGLAFMGLSIDARKNEAAVGGKEEVDISLPGSRVKILVIPTNEELRTAEDVYSLLAKIAPSRCEDQPVLPNI
jgi:acetate kinase